MDFIPTKRNNVRYKFITPTNYQNRDNEVKDDSYYFFYQITTYPDPKTDRYHLRKFVLNNKDEFKAVNEYHLTKSQCKKFYSTKKRHEYKQYAVYNLNNVNYPT